MGRKVGAADRADLDAKDERGGKSLTEKAPAPACRRHAACLR
jgi:hypothetical protein